MPPHEPLFPHALGPPGGHTFASTLLLSFACAPLLKQHVLRTLDMTNEDLASLEPILADTWEHWNRARRTQQQQIQQQAQQDAAATAAMFPLPPSPPSTDAVTNEIMAHFHRPLVAPTPLKTDSATDSDSDAGSMPSSSGGTATVTDTTTATTRSAAIGPHLAIDTKSESPA